MRSASVIIVILSLVFIVSAFSRPAESAMLVYPHLIEMDVRNRTASLTLTNLGVTEERYRISLGYIALDENGNAVEIAPGPEHLSAIEFIRFMPRSVALASGEHQVVRLRLILPPNLNDGEYRAHIFFEQVPKVVAPLNDPIPPGELMIQLIPLQRVGIPIIVEKGDLFKKGELSEIRLKEIEGRPHLSFRVTSTGSRSLRGNIEIEILPSGRDRFIPLFVMSNFVVYTPGMRKVIIPLEKEGLILDPNSRLRVIYREMYGGPIIAQAEIKI